MSTFVDSHTDEVLGTALRMAELGFGVIPIYPPAFDGNGCSCPLGENCKSPGKHPYTPLVPRGIQDATTSPAKIKKWFTDKDLNIAVTGGTKYLIVDFDSSDAYFSWLEENQWARGTLRAKSGSGDGYHVYVKVEPGTKVSNYNHKYGEVRGVNQYVVIPPSLHVSGGHYEWIEENALILTAKPEQLPTRVGLRGSINAEDIDFGDEPPDHRAVEKFIKILPPFVLAYINSPDDADDRSEADWALVRELVKAGASDHDILSIYLTTPLSESGKFAEKGSHGLSYLKNTIARARGETSEEQRVVVVTKGTVKIDLGISEEVAEQLQSFAPDDDGNAHSVLAVHPDKFLWNTGFGWMSWNGKYWQSEGSEARLERAIIDTFTIRHVLGGLRNDDNGKAILRASRRMTNNVNATKAMVKSLVSAKASAEAFDRHEDLLNVNNGVVNLRTGELGPHDPNLYFSYALEVDYRPSAKSLLWEKLIREMFIPENKSLSEKEIEEVLTWVQLAVGYSITGSTREEKFFYVYGRTRSGKGTFSETLINLLRKPLAYGTDFKSFTTENNDPQGYRLAPLRNARFVVASESSSYDWLNAEVVKRLTGGDEIQASLKYQNFFGFRPQWKFWLFSNFPPKGDPRDNALWYRADAIRLENSFAGREDKSLKGKLSTTTELEGILAWAVEGAIRWWKEGLKTPRVVSQFTKESREEVDYTAQWLSEYAVLGGPEDFVPSHALYESYRAWMEPQGLKVKSMNGLSRDLTQMEFVFGRKSIKGVQQRVVFGIKFVSTKPIPDHDRELEEI
jgi:putative DNA primase/helicase